MKKFGIACLIIGLGMLLFCGNAHAQTQVTPDQRVSNLTSVPDLSDRASGWRVVTNDDGSDKLGKASITLEIKKTRDANLVIVWGPLIFHPFENKIQGLTATLVKRPMPEGEKEIVMFIGSEKLYRTALKIDGQWFLSKDSAEDPTGLVEFGDFEFDNEMNLDSFSMNIITSEGLKKLVIRVK